MSNIPPNTPTIPIKQVTAKKFIPLVVASPNQDLKIPAKLFDDQKLQSFIQDILIQFETIKDKNSALYAIRLSSSNQYINEKNRFDLLSLNDQIKFHDVDLCFNLETEVKTYVEKITGIKITNADGLISQLISVEKFIAADKIFAYEFYAKGGKKIIVDFIKECERSNEAKKWILFYHLYKILILFIKNWTLFSWDTSETELHLLKLICEILNDSTRENKKSSIPDYLVLLFLQIVNDVILNSSSARELIFKELKFNDIIFVIQRQEIQIKETLLIFLNCCFLIGDVHFKKSLYSILSQPLMNAVLREGSLDDRNSDRIYYNFAMLQKNLLDIDYATRVRIVVDKSHMNKIKTICNCAFEQTGTNASEKQLTDDEKLAKLGFTNISNPIEDFNETPPGILALDFMEFFATKQSLRPIFQNFVSEKCIKNSEYAFPFVKASFYMVKYMYELLQIGKDEFDKHTEILFVMFTISPEGILDFFSKMLWMFHRLWIEMKAQSLDFDRALSALKDSLYIILTDVNKNDKTNSNGFSSVIKRKLNDLNNLIDTWKYDFIKKGKNRYDKFNLEPVKELEKILTEEVIQMLKPKRVGVLCKGEVFEKINLKEKRYRHKQIWKLSSDYKTFNISEYENLQSKEIKNTTQLDVERIKEVRKEEPRKQVFHLQIVCYRLDEQGEEIITLTNQSEEVIDEWFDGFNILINPKPTPNITCFVDCLIDVQLLDIHTLGLEIPQNQLKIPELPTNFEFNLVA